VVVAVRAVLVATPHSASVTSSPLFVHLRVFEFTRILPERLLALFADKDHVEGLRQRVVGLLRMALGAVEPFFAWP
jgi:hypothetical protein